MYVLSVINHVEESLKNKERKKERKRVLKRFTKRERKKKKNVKQKTDALVNYQWFSVQVLVIISP